MAMTDGTIILRSLMSRKFSTVTTIITVAVAVALMLVLLMMRDAGRRAFERGIGTMHMLVSRESSPLVAVLNTIFYAKAPGRAIEWSKFKEIAAHPLLEFAIPTQQGDSYRGAPVLATTPEFFTKYQPHLDQGWSFAEGRAFQWPFEVVVGAEAAKSTGLRLGDHVHLTHGVGRDAGGMAARDDDAAEGHEHHDHHGAHVHHEFEFVVVGILEPTGTAHDRAIFTDLAGSWIIHAHDRRQRDDPHVKSTTEADLIDADRLITAIFLRVATRSGAAVSAAQQQVFDALRRDASITVADPGAQVQTLFTIVSNIDQVFLGMAAVVMVSSGIGIMLALYNSMEQRRRQIAVLRVLGCSRGRVFALVLTESAVLGVLGAIVGIALAVLGAWIVRAVMEQRLGLVIQPRLETTWTIVVSAATVLLATLAGLAPAALAYRTPVARNLRPLG
jgi:putative ABC transport system permease protein